MEQDNLYRYLDAKFDAIDKHLTLQRERSDKLENLFLEGLTPRIDRLESWRSILTGAGIVLFALLAWVANQTPNLWAFLQGGK